MVRSVLSESGSQPTSIFINNTAFYCDHAPFGLDIAPIHCDHAPFDLDIAPIGLDIAPIHCDHAPIDCDHAGFYRDDALIDLLSTNQ